jgi:Holliday junction resolvase RusA-like endonuclease
MTQVIIGICPSKSNCYKIGDKSLYKTPALVAYEQAFYLQCNKYRNANIKGLFEFNLRVFYPSNKADLDNSLKVTLDCLQHVKAIANDNKCIKIVAEKFLDKANPRIEFSIVPV